MKRKKLSVRRLFRWVSTGLALSMTTITVCLFLVTKQMAVLPAGGALLLCAFIWLFVLTQALGKRLALFTSDLCHTLDHMITGSEAPGARRIAKHSLPGSAIGWQGFTGSCRRIAAGWTRNGRSYRPLFRIFPIR